MNTTPLIFCLCAILVISGCGEGESYSFAEKKRNAISTIKDQLEAVRKAQHNDNPKIAAYGRYAEPKLIKALEYLNKLLDPKSIEQPFPVLARFEKSTNKKIYRPFFYIIWLEEGMNVAEIFIEDEKGNMYEFPAFHQAKEEYITYNKSTFFRMDTARVSVTEGRKPEELSNPIPTAVKLSVFPISLESFRGEIKIGLITTEGEKTPTIKAFVEPGFYEESKPQQQKPGKQEADPNTIM